MRKLITLFVLLAISIVYSYGADFDLTVTQTPSTNPDVCQTATYQVQVKNNTANDLKPNIVLVQ